MGDFNKSAGIARQMGLNCREEIPTQVPPRKGSKALAGPCWGTVGHRTRGFSWTHWRNICQGLFKCVDAEWEMAWQTSQVSQYNTAISPHACEQEKDSGSCGGGCQHFSLAATERKSSTMVSVLKMRKLRHTALLGWKFGIWLSTELSKKASALSSRMYNPVTRDLVEQLPSWNMFFDKIIKIRARAHFCVYVTLLREIVKKNIVFWFIEYFRKSLIPFMRCMHKRNLNISLHFICL